VTDPANDHNGSTVKARLWIVVPLALALLAVGLVGASSGADSAGALARAYAIRVVVPGGGSATPTISSPPSDAVAPGSGFSYSGSEGPAVTTGSYVASVQSDSTGNPFANASAEVADLSLFNGEVTASDIVARAKASARPGSASGDLSGVGVSGLTVDGQPAGPGRVTLGDWGYADVNVHGSAPTATSFRGFATALDVHLTADHGGLPAGTEIQVGYAEVSVQAPPAPPKVKKKQPAAGAKHKAVVPRRPPEPAKPTPGIPPEPLPRRLPPAVHPHLTSPGGYVFPVYGPSSYTDTFGAFRGDVAGNWHHGDDIFAPLGAPVLAVAKGTVFSVGWNDIGGNRLWLLDGQGNQFYYAHLSAYTPLAVNNAHVEAGAVLGFVGNTGDAEGTPYHLHFEIHPVGLLGMGYDGVVDPTRYLDAWKHLQDLRFATAAGWAPAQASGGAAPRAGAVLLQSSDISTANGLAPGSLEKALKVAATEGAAGILGTTGLRPSRGRVLELASPRTRLD
jgi:murein DD-endopeptidase MepM/ murein hydrolase activator NlpD